MPSELRVKFHHAEPGYAQQFYEVIQINERTLERETPLLICAQEETEGQYLWYTIEDNDWCEPCSPVKETFTIRDTEGTLLRPGIDLA